MCKYGNAQVSGRVLILQSTIDVGWSEISSEDIQVE
jgi:hypothetical protein